MLGTFDGSQVFACGRDDPQSTGTGDVEIALLVHFDPVERILSGCASHIEEDLALKGDRNAALQWGSAWESQRRDAAIFDLFFKFSARPAEDRCCPGFAHSDVNARNLGIIEALEYKQVAPVVHH